MEDRLPEREYFTIRDIECLWNVSADDVEYWIREGRIPICVWLPMMSVYKRMGLQIGEPIHFEGYAAISRHMCSRIFRSGVAGFREFRSVGNDTVYVLPDSAPEICIERHDLYMNRHHVTVLIQEAITIKTHDFRSIKIDGTLYHLGEMQAQICSLLLEGAQHGEPWQNGKRLLEKVGSGSDKPANVFKHHPAYAKLIQSDGRGRYRLHERICNILTSH